ncbi:MAG TPA: hypothetical protein VN943_11725 [Candidatus Acidoferrum sp.]|nr:hypothetical protein [Candidatus Acidoferrum sp.]
MEHGIGLILALAVAGMATVIDFERERAFYPTVLIVVASYRPSLVYSKSRGAALVAGFLFGV